MKKKLILALFLSPLTLAAQIINPGNGAVLLQSQTVSGASSATFTGWYSPSYRNYEIIASGVTFSAPADLQIQMSTNGGTSYDSSALYAYAYNYRFAGGTPGNGSQSGNAVTAIAARGSNTTLAANGSFNFSAILLAPAAATFKHLQGFVTFDDATIGFMTEAWSGEYQSATAVNAFKVQSSAGTFSGTVEILGIP